MKIQVEALSKSYRRVRALREVSLTFEPGQIVALVGPNGAGKTTLLRCLAGIVAPDRGGVRYDGEEFRRDRLDLRRRFHFLPDYPALFSNMTVLRHIGMILRLYGADDEGVELRVLELLRDLDMLPLSDAQIAGLSRGQIYKTALLGLMTVNPEVWLLDEPFASGMDPQGISTFKQRAHAAVAQNRTVIYSTQILDVAERFADHVGIIHHGELRAFDTMGRLREQAGREHGVLEELFRRLHQEDA